MQAFVLHWLGRPLFCECGTIHFWVNEVDSRETSQQIADWYTFSHVVHGFLLYGLLFLAARKLPKGVRLIFAVLFESGWEMIENSRFIIDRYRQSALANGYVGDSILNSLSDSLSMILGFAIAGAGPISLTVAMGLIAEVVCAVVIRDNLTLNIINLIHPFEFISRWQKG